MDILAILFVGLVIGFGLGMKAEREREARQGSTPETATSPCPPHEWSKWRDVRVRSVAFGYPGQTRSCSKCGLRENEHRLVSST